MDSKVKAHSSPGTPLTIKWAEELGESKAGETESHMSGRRPGTLVFAFVIGLVGFGSSSWLLDERLWVVHSLLGGFLACSWVQRWGEKHLGWQRAELDKLQISL